MNNLFDKDLMLLEPDHKYKLASDPNFQFKSVTEAVSKYFEPFDAHAIAENLVATYPKYIGMEVSELIKDWDAARDFGTKVHKEIELFIKDSVLPKEVQSFDAIEWLKKYQMKSEITIHTELRIYSKELNLAGSIDILAHDTQTNKYEIIDWKTSKSIDKTSFDNKMGTHQITSHLMDCKFVHYSMQLSFYRYLLEEYYGLKINNQLIAHLNGNSCVAHVGDYYKKEIIDIIQEQKI